MSAIKYLDKSGLTYFWGKVKGIVSPKADKSEMSVTPGTGDNADKTTIQLKQGTSATVLTQHQDVSGKMNKVNAATSGHLAKFNGSGQVVDGGDTADYAKNLTGPVVQSDAEFVYRKTGGSLSVDGKAGGAVIEKVNGRTLVWNQIVPLSRKTFTNTNTDTRSNGFLFDVRDNELSPHIYETVYILDAGRHTLIFTAQSSSSIQLKHNGVTRDLIIIPFSESVNVVFAHKYLLSMLVTGYDISTLGGLTIDNIMLVDLTLMFGEGNEPSTVAEFESMFPGPYYDYNAGTLINNAATGIETIGFNLWDEELEKGSIDVNTGQNIVTTTNSRSKNYIPGFPNENYYINAVVYRYFYDENKNFILFDNTGSLSFTFPENARYLRFRQTTDDLPEHICINLSDASRNGTYEPHWKVQTPFNITTAVGRREGDNPKVVFSDGLKSAGSVYDEIVGNRAIKRVGSVDLGTLDYSANGNVFRASLANIKKSVSINSTPNIVCPMYHVDTPVHLTTTDMTISSDETSNKIGVHNNAYTSATDMKAALSGVYAHYELETPEEYILDEPLNLDYPVDGGGTEKRLPADTSSSVLAPFLADIEYALNGIGTLQRLDDNYVNRRNVVQEAGNDPNKVMSQKTTTELMESLASRITVVTESKDLSYYDIFGRGTLLQNTANCYVVENMNRMSYNSIKIPLVYGNGIKNGKPNPAAYTRLGSTYTADFVNHLGNQIVSPYIEENQGCTAASCGVLWQTKKAVFLVNIVDGKDCRYLNIRTDASSVPYDALSVVYVADANGDIMWSWMLWFRNDNVSLYNPLTTVKMLNHTGVEYEFLNYNLGAISLDSSGHYVSPFYQWGRKDPMPPASAYNANTDMALVDASGNTYSGYGTYGVADDADQGGTVRSVANSIKMPNKFFLEYNTTTYNWNNLSWMNNFWNAAITGSSDLADNQATAIKTIYDPCPVGFMVPCGRAFTGFTTTGNNSDTAIEFNVVGSFDAGWKFKKNSGDTSGNYWPASGYRSKADGALSYTGSSCFYLSFAPYSQVYTQYLNINSGYVGPLNKGNRGYGFGVRPVRELT